MVRYMFLCLYVSACMYVISVYVCLTDRQRDSLNVFNILDTKPIAKWLIFTGRYPP